MPGDIRVGDCSRDEMRDYLRQLDSERGRPRVWILLTHALVAERRLILDYLDRIGQRLDEFDAPADDPSAASASTILYDLSNPEKLAGASARDFPVRAGYAAPIASCYGTMSPIQGRDRRAREALASTP